ncbi:hypothetical protein [Marinobacter sp. HL-58]|uniref:hypothetical protein n=1 Tax=Marinobacter sp. HL-58 TaxID=1479237 RepID=UPI00047F4E33|nr:hypothetical protein [Marinobacter sp. HL-58]
MNGSKKCLYRPLALALATLALSACGGSSDGDSDTGSGNAPNQESSSADNNQSVDSSKPQPTFKEDYSENGSFSEPFAEPTIIVDGEAVETDEKCVTNAEGLAECKPAAGTLALLDDGRLLYLNALEGTENALMVTKLNTNLV